MQTSAPARYNDIDNKTNRIIIERFLASIKSDVTRKGALDYIHAYMRYHRLYEGGEEVQENNSSSKNKKNKNNSNSKLVYRYDWLIGRDGNNDVQTIENMIIDFVVYKKDKEGLGAAAIDNYINHLVNFYWVARVRGIDWRLVKRHKPDNVKKTQDREYYAEEVIAIEENLDARGKVVSGVMRGSGVRRGAVQLISVGDLFPIQTKYYGKAYKIIVYRGTSDMYATACIPEVATKIDDYFKYRMRFGEVCKYYGKSRHKHELHDGYEVIEKWYDVDEPHLDPDAPLIREDFDRDDPFAARYPKRISKEQIADIVRDAAVASGVRNVNKNGQIHERHKTMCTHGLRKLFNKRCRQKKVDPIIRARLLGQKSGDPKEGISKLMMTYDPEEWAEMQAEFESAIPHLTITEAAIVKTKLEQAQAQLQNVPTIEQLQSQLKEAEESKKKRIEELEAKQEILQANAASVLNALMAAEMGVKSPPEVKLITWRSDEGQEGLFEAAAVARVENEAREKEHQRRHHKQKQ